MSKSSIAALAIVVSVLAYLYIAAPSPDAVPLGIAARNGICIVDPTVAASAGTRIDVPVDVTPPVVSAEDQRDGMQQDVSVRTAANRRLSVGITALRPCNFAERFLCPTTGGQAVGPDGSTIWIHAGERLEVLVPMSHGWRNVDWIMDREKPYRLQSGPLVSCAAVRGR